MKRYEQVPHTADLAARIYGKTAEELFENAAFAMFDMMADLEAEGGGEVLEVEAQAPDTESLLVDLLNELLYAGYIKNTIFSQFRVVELNGNKAIMEARGKKSPEGANLIRKEIKAATYHDLDIEHNNSGYEVTIVFDV